MRVDKLRNTWNLVKFAYNWRIARNTVGSNLPVEVSIEVTNVCNFKCHFCPQSDPKHFDELPKTYLEPEQARALVRKVREFGYRKPMLHWTLDGEPFMNKKLPDICTVAAQEGFNNQCFQTNGTLLTEENMKRLPRSSRCQFRIDYCSDPEYFETYRGTRGSWTKVRDNISRILNDASFDNVHFVVTDISTFTVTDPTDLAKTGHPTKAPRARIATSRTMKVVSRCATWSGRR